MIRTRETLSEERSDPSESARRATAITCRPPWRENTHTVHQAKPQLFAWMTK
jgi:hypothetical protein